MASVFRSRAFAILSATTAVAGTAAYLSLRGRPDPSPNAYGPVKVVLSEPHARDTRRIVLQLPASTMELVARTPVPFHLDVKNTDLVVARSYTPVHVDTRESTVELLVKRYPVGETGKWMHRRVAGDHIEVCGPICEWAVPPPPPALSSDLGQQQSPATLGMIAGGTGVTPFIQLLDAALGTPSEYPTSAPVLAQWPKLSLVYLARSDADVLDRELLDRLVAAHPDRLSVRYVTGGRGQLTPELIQETMPAPGQGLVMVCGPEGLVRTVAGSMGREYGSQGPLGGILHSLGYRAEEVHKMQ